MTYIILGVASGLFAYAIGEYLRIEDIWARIAVAVTIYALAFIMLEVAL